MRACVRGMSFDLQLRKLRNYEKSRSYENEIKTTESQNRFVESKTITINYHQITNSLFFQLKKTQTYSHYLN